MRFRRKETYGHPNPIMTLEDILVARVYPVHGQGQMEDMQDELASVSGILAGVLRVLLDNDLASAEDICAIVNTTQGFDIEPVLVGRG